MKINVLYDIHLTSHCEMSYKVRNGQGTLYCHASLFEHEASWTLCLLTV